MTGVEAVTGDRLELAPLRCPDNDLDPTGETSGYRKGVPSCDDGK